jgi:hypothetical protein
VWVYSPIVFSRHGCGLHSPAAGAITSRAAGTATARSHWQHHFRSYRFWATNQWNKKCAPACGQGGALTSGEVIIDAVKLAVQQMEMILKHDDRAEVEGAMSAAARRWGVTPPHRLQ